MVTVVVEEAPVDTTQVVTTTVALAVEVLGMEEVAEAVALLEDAPTMALEGAEVVALVATLCLDTPTLPASSVETLNTRQPTALRIPIISMAAAPVSAVETPVTWPMVVLFFMDTRVLPLPRVPTTHSRSRPLSTVMPMAERRLSLSTVVNFDSRRSVSST